MTLWVKNYPLNSDLSNGYEVTASFEQPGPVHWRRFFCLPLWLGISSIEHSTASNTFPNKAIETWIIHNVKRAFTIILILLPLIANTISWFIHSSNTADSCQNKAWKKKTILQGQIFSFRPEQDSPALRTKKLSWSLIWVTRFYQIYDNYHGYYMYFNFKLVLSALSTSSGKYFE